MFAALVAIWFGIYDYRTFPAHAYDTRLEWIIIAPLMVFLLAEVIYKRTQKFELNFVPKKVSSELGSNYYMTVQEF